MGASGDTEGSQKEGHLHGDLKELVGQEMTFWTKGTTGQGKETGKRASYLGKQ